MFVVLHVYLFVIVCLKFFLLTLVNQKENCGLAEEVLNESFHRIAMVVRAQET